MDAAAIAAAVPHAGAMCLLDGVLSCSAAAIECVAQRPLRSDNPLLERGRLHAMALLEYGAQAAAVHAAMAGGSAAPARGGAATAGRPAYLAAVKDLAVAGDWLDAEVAALTVRACCVSAGAGGAIYRVSVEALGVVQLSARITLAQPG